MNLSLYDLIREAQTGNKEATLTIIRMFNPKIKKSLNKTSYQNREDLEQELKLKIIQAIHKYELY